MTCFPTSTVASVLPKSLISLTRRSTRRPLDGGNGPLQPVENISLDGARRSPLDTPPYPHETWVSDFMVSRLGL